MELNSIPTGTGMLRRILVVDDDSTIRDNLKTYLSQYHPANYAIVVEEASTAGEAEEKLKQNDFDLVISDINLPDRDGFYVLERSQSMAQKPKCALITAYDMETYIERAQVDNVHNILVKTAPFNFAELSRLVDNLLFPDQAFGLDKYLDTPQEALQQYTLSSSNDIMTVCRQLRPLFEGKHSANVDVLEVVVVEALTNAVYHAVKNSDGSLKYHKGDRIEVLLEPEQVVVTAGIDDEKLGISILDKGGSMTAEDILYWLSRNVRGELLLEPHGRGLYLIHRLIDRLIVNIQKNQQTELILLHYFENEDLPENKPLFINQQAG